MEKLNHRIWCCDLKEHRELLSVKRNAYGDILFELDSGLTRQFKPNREIEDFPIERVHVIGRGYDSKTGLISLMGSVVLKNPHDSVGGNWRDIQSPEREKAAVKEALKESQIATRGDIETEGHAIRATIQSGFDSVMDWGERLLEKVGLKKRNTRFPEVASSNQKKALDMWTRWPYTCLEAQSGTKKVDCFTHYKSQLSKMGITELDHFKAVLDNARKP